MSSRRHRGERGQATVIIVGFAVVILLLVVVVIDATAAYIKRQDLDSIADGAALYAADAAAQGREVYDDGLGHDDLRLSAGVARAAAASYLREVGAHHSHPGLTLRVTVDGTSVRIEVSAPADLPLAVPGGPEDPRVRAVGSAVVRPGAGAAG